MCVWVYIYVCIWRVSYFIFPRRRKRLHDAYIIHKYIYMNCIISSYASDKSIEGGKIRAYIAKPLDSFLARVIKKKFFLHWLYSGVCHCHSHCPCPRPHSQLCGIVYAINMSISKILFFPAPRHPLTLSLCSFSRTNWRSAGLYLEVLGQYKVEAKFQWKMFIYI